jgi:hypothetical protein
MIRRRVVGVVGSLGRSTTWPSWPVATRRIVEQTRQRLAGTTPDGVTRRVSLYDPDARPIRKGRLGKPVDFGHKPRPGQPGPDSARP